MSNVSKIKNIDKLYGNHKVYSPDGEFMFMGNNKKVNWYLNKGLAIVISEENDVGGKDVQLLFEPNGTGHSEDDPYYLKPKENMCVVSGCLELTELTKHHVIPYCFRKHFPLEFKDRSSHDIVLLTREVHYDYENNYATSFKNELAIEYGVPTHEEYSASVSRSNPARSTASTLLSHSDKIPIDKVLDLMIKFETKTGIKATRWNMEEYLKNTELNRPDPWGKLIVEKVDDIQRFAERWRQHFLDSMKPQYMPKGWSVKRSITK
jgi:hypothetical protein